VVLRPRQDSISHPGSPVQKSPLPSPSSRPQLLLESAHRAPEQIFHRWARRVRTIANRRIVSPSIRLAILAAQLLITLQPCLSEGMNSLVVYPLICMAMLEFSIPNLKFWQVGLALMLHSALLYLAWRTDRLCRTSDATWSWEGD
jgi:hypothetical protein